MICRSKRGIASRLSTTRECIWFCVYVCVCNPSLYSGLIIKLNQSGLMASSNGPSVKSPLPFRLFPQFNVLHLDYRMNHSTHQSCSKIQAMHVINKMKVL